MAKFEVGDTVQFDDGKNRTHRKVLAVYDPPEGTRLDLVLWSEGELASWTACSESYNLVEFEPGKRYQHVNDVEQKSVLEVVEVRGNWVIGFYSSDGWPFGMHQRNRKNYILLED